MSRDIAVHGDDQAIAALAAMVGSDVSRWIVLTEFTTWSLLRVTTLHTALSYVFPHAMSWQKTLQTLTQPHVISLPINASSQLHNSAVLCCDLGIQNAH